MIAVKCVLKFPSDIVSENIREIKETNDHYMRCVIRSVYYFRWLLADYIKVSNLSADQMLYTETDLDNSMEKIETMHFHQEKEVSGIKFWAYNAGHVLGILY